MNVSTMRACTNATIRLLNMRRRYKMDAWTPFFFFSLQSILSTLAPHGSGSRQKQSQIVKPVQTFGETQLPLYHIRCTAIMKN